MTRYAGFLQMILSYQYFEEILFLGQLFPLGYVLLYVTQ